MSSTTFFFIFIPLLATILLAVNLIFAPHNPYQEKRSVFECGFHSFLGQNRTQFTISFFIFALLFLLFDLEILLVYPYVVSAYTNDIYGLVIVLIFLLALALGFTFELGKNALNIESRQTLVLTNINNNNNNNNMDITSVVSGHLFSKIKGKLIAFLRKRGVSLATLVLLIKVFAVYSIDHELWLRSLDLLNIDIEVYKLDLDWASKRYIFYLIAWVIGVNICEEHVLSPVEIYEKIHMLLNTPIVLGGDTNMSNPEQDKGKVPWGVYKNSDAESDSGLGNKPDVGDPSSGPSLGERQGIDQGASSGSNAKPEVTSFFDSDSSESELESRSKLDKGKGRAIDSDNEGYERKLDKGKGRAIDSDNEGYERKLDKGKGRAIDSDNESDLAYYKEISSMTRSEIIATKMSLSTTAQVMEDLCNDGNLTPEHRINLNSELEKIYPKINQLSSRLANFDGNMQDDSAKNYRRILETNRNLNEQFAEYADQKAKFKDMQENHDRIKTGFDLRKLKDYKHMLQLRFQLEGRVSAIFAKDISNRTNMDNIFLAEFDKNVCKIPQNITNAELVDLFTMKSLATYEEACLVTTDARTKFFEYTMKGGETPSPVESIKGRSPTPENSSPTRTIREFEGYEKLFRNAVLKERGSSPLNEVDPTGSNKADPSGSSEAGPSRSSEAGPSGSRNYGGPSGSSEAGPSGWKNYSGPSGSSGAGPSGSSEAGPSGSSENTRDNSKRNKDYENNSSNDDINSPKRPRK